MQNTMRGDRLHISFFGKRNAGKSALINAVTGQQVAIVSDIPGTTTDPVFKSMELMPIGPVVLIDTAGIDDTGGALADERVKRSEGILGKTDLALLVVDSRSTDFTFEEELIARFTKSVIPYIIVLNKIDTGISDETTHWLSEKPFVRTSAVSGAGIDELKKRILDAAPTEWEPPFLKDLINPGDIVLLVTPIDLGAPKGRLIMPQVKALRDALDGDAIPVMCKERELITAMSRLSSKPALVITDSQVFPQVAADVPSDIPLTSFSILSIRQKGDLAKMVEGVLAVKNLKHGDKVLIAESCTHHPLEDDIGRVKIPRWLQSFVGASLDIHTVPGCNYPDNLEEYKLVIHCGGCTLNRKEMLRRQSVPAQIGVPVTNYGVLISFLKGVFPRALMPFNEIYQLVRENKKTIDQAITRKMARLTEL